MKCFNCIEKLKNLRTHWKTYNRKQVTKCSLKLWKISLFSVIMISACFFLWKSITFLTLIVRSVTSEKINFFPRLLEIKLTSYKLWYFVRINNSAVCQRISITVYVKLRSESIFCSLRKLKTFVCIVWYVHKCNI